MRKSALDSVDLQQYLNMVSLVECVFCGSSCNAVISMGSCGASLCENCYRDFESCLAGNYSPNVTSLTAKSYIYGMIDPRDGAIRYVGFTKNPQVRLMAHKNFASQKAGKPRWLWTSELAKLNLAPQMEILETTCPYHQEWCEGFWIRTLIDNGTDLLNTGYRTIHRYQFGIDKDFLPHR